MPKKQRTVQEGSPPLSSSLVPRLADELAHAREAGQPLIDEETYPSGNVRVTVIWDEWAGIPHDDRTHVILQAYETAQDVRRHQIALASGFTFAEAIGLGMLPYEVLPAVRKDDPVSLPQCHQAMIEEGATQLIPGQPRLRFGTQEEAEAMRRRLARRLPNSEPVWLVNQEVGSVAEWADR